MIGKLNDIYVCQDDFSDTKDRYTIVVIKDHTTFKKYIDICVAYGKDENEFLVDYFTDGSQYIMVFPYTKRRPLSDFYVGDAMSLLESEQVCRELVLSCIQSALPFPLLYLVLRQGQLNLNRDLTVYLTYEFDLTELDETKGEKDCVVECARILLGLYESKQKQKAISYTLLEKKIHSYGYSRFSELYKDITIAAAPKRKANIVKRAMAFFEANKDRFFAALVFVCVILIIVAVLCFVSQLIWGDVPWLSVFFNNFKEIGTESLYL